MIQVASYEKALSKVKAKTNKLTLSKKPFRMTACTILVKLNTVYIYFCQFLMVVAEQLA
jgi:hypothetical protein